MKSVSFAEFDGLVENAQAFIGARIEGILFENDILSLQLRDKQKTAVLVIDVRNRVPFFTITSEPTPRFQKQIKPIVLFLRAHALGLRLQSVERQKKYGRLIEFVFSGENKSLTLEAHLFPQGKNIKVFTEEASICLKKPQDLTEVADAQPPADVRSAGELYAAWLEQFSKIRKEGGAGSRTQEALQAGVTAQIARKEASLQKLLDHKKKLEESRWPEFAHWLNEARTDIVPKKYAEFFDPKKSVTENIEIAFIEAKKVKSKLKGVEERFQSVQNEIAALPTTGAGTSPVSTKVPVSPLQGVRGRTREFAENIRGYIGKSGTDNLKLLRQSKSWYIWVHAKDWPSAHAIIAINKGQKVPPSVLKDVCLWVLRETVSEKQWQSWLGIKVDFLYTERRFLQAIKGDHHGRVRYAEAKTITLVVE